MKDAIESLIRLESRLLDEGKLDDWLALYTEDARYWLPIDEAADPMKDSSVIYDDHLRLSMRVEQIMRQRRVSHTPGTESVRIVSSPEITEIDGEHAEARFGLLVVEVRSGDWRQQGLGETRLYPGTCTMAFRRDGDAWKVASKTFVLLNRKQPILGLSFIL